MTTYRFILRMGDHTLPRKAMIKRGDGNVLVKNLLKRLGGRKSTADEDANRLQMCTSLNSVKQSRRLRWKHKLHKSHRRQYGTQIDNMQTKLIHTTSKRINHNLDQPADLRRHINAFDTGTAYLMSLKLSLGLKSRETRNFWVFSWPRGLQIRCQCGVGPKAP